MKPKKGKKVEVAAPSSDSEMSDHESDQKEKPKRAKTPPKSLKKAAAKPKQKEPVEQSDSEMEDEA